MECSFKAAMINFIHLGQNMNTARWLHHSLLVLFVFGVTSVGFNPTFAGKNISVETYLFDFDEDLYEKGIKIFFLKRLRGERTFSGPESLKTQIAKDIQQAKTWLTKGGYF